MNPCACGCGNTARKKWVHGHNPKRQGAVIPRGECYLAKSGYRYLHLPEHPHAHNGYIEEHRVIMERELGRPLTKDEIVHHKNHCRSDNRVENLEVMLKRDHDRHHTLVATECVVCGAPHKARGLCSVHYGRYQRSGTPMPFAPSRGGRWSSRKKAA